MDMSMEGHVFPKYRLTPNRDLAARFLHGQGVDPKAEGALDRVPPTYMVFLRGEMHGVKLFHDLDIKYEKALHGGQKYEWFGEIGWDDEVEVTATVTSMAEKSGKRGSIWFADVTYEYVRADTGELVLRELSRMIEQE